jgi:hypothetical protein
MEVLDTEGLTHSVTHDVTVMIAEEHKVYVPLVMKGP